MAMVINEEQQMLKESAQGFLAEFAPLAELRKQRDAAAIKVMPTIYGGRWRIWVGRQYWFPKLTVVWSLAMWVWVR